MSEELIINVSNLQQTKILACKIANLVSITDTITLKGDLGAGKTTFCGYMINEMMGNSENITSPTFNIVHNYNFHTKLGKSMIWHFDLYRLKHMDEIFELGYEEALQQVMFIEWPEIIRKYLPKERLDIAINSSHDHNRSYIFNAHGQWINKIRELKL